MAIENVKILGVDTTQSVDNLRNLKEQIKELKDALQALEIGSEEYEQTAEALYAKQQRLNQVMADAKRPVEAAAGSYYALNQELVELRKTYRSLSEEERNSDFGVDTLLRIQQLDSQLKGIDASMGQHFRNVGNYSDSVIDAFQQLGISATGILKPLNKLGLDMGLVVTSIKAFLAISKAGTAQASGLSRAITTMANSVGGASKAFTGLKGAILATGIGALILALGTVIALWDDIKDAIGRTQTPMDILIRQTDEFLERSEDANTSLNRMEKVMKALGASQLVIAAYRAKKLREQIDDANSRIVAQKTYLNQLNAWWMKVGRTLAKIYSYIQYILPGMSGIANTFKDFYGTEEDVKALEESISKLEDQQKNLNNQYKDTGVELFSLMVAEEDEKVKKTTKSVSKLADEQKRLFEETMKQAEQMMDEDMKALDSALKLWDDIAKARRSDIEKERQDYEEKKKTLERYGLDTEDLERTHQEKMAELSHKKAEDEKKQAEELLEFNRQMAEKMKEARGETIGELDIEALAEQYDAELEAYKAYIEAKIALNAELMQSYEEGSARRVELERENALLVQDIAVKQAEVERKKADDYKKLMKARSEATKNMAAQTSDILSSVSQAMGENTRAGKAFAIASATIDTIASAVAGFRAGYNQWKDASAMAWMAPVQGAINATAALVAGYAQVQKIASVDTSGTNANAGGAATALAMPNIEGLSSPVDYTRQVTTEQEREELNRDQRVYILESDIQQSNRRVKVREEESTF